MAKSNKAVSTPVAAAPAKVAKPAKAAPAAATPAKPAKAKPAPASGQQAKRGQYAGMTIKNVAGSDTPCRGDALVRFNAIVAHKKVDDAIGAEYTTAAGEVRKLQSVDLAYLVKRGLIEIA